MKPKAKERFCWNCGASLGVIEDRHYDRGDICDSRDCAREARDQAGQDILEREPPHG